MLSPILEQTIERALSFARERRHPHAILEHLLLALLDDTDAAPILRACNVDTNKIRAQIIEFVDKDLAAMASDQAGDPTPAAGFQRTVDRAASHAQSAGREQVNGGDVLVALFSERESHAVYFLQLQDMTRLDAVNFVLHGLTKRPPRSGQVLGSIQPDASSDPATAHAILQIDLAAIADHGQNDA